MANPAKRLLMEPYPEDEFIKAVKEVVLANQDFVSPYGSSGTLYLDPKEHKYIDEFGGATFMALLRMVNSKHQNQTQFYLQSLNVLF